MTATQKYRTSPLPAAIPAGFARSPAGSRVATVRFAHPFAVVAVAFHASRNHDPSPAPGGWHGLAVFSARVSEPDDAEPPLAASR